MDIQQIISAIDDEYISIINSQELNVASVSYNSKKSEPNSLFVAIEGSNFDGNDYINDAINRGAKVIISSKLDLNYV